MAILNFPNTGLVANVTQYIGDNGTTYTWDGVKWVGRSTGVLAGVQIQSDWTQATNTSLDFIKNKPTLATVATSGSYADLVNKPNLAGSYQFSVAADDSTQRVISTDEVVKFIGAGGITTASDTEGNITITGSVLTPANGDGVSGNANLVFYAGNWYNTSRLTINPATSMLTINGDNGVGGITLPRGGIIKSSLQDELTMTVIPGTGGNSSGNLGHGVDQSPASQWSDNTTYPTGTLCRLTLIGATGDWIQYNNVTLYTRNNNGTNIVLCPNSTLTNTIDVVTGTFASGTLTLLSDSVAIQSNASTWTFGSDGVLTLPNDLTIDGAPGNYGIRIGGTSTWISVDNEGAPPGFMVATAVGGADHRWLFADDGVLTLPEGGDINIPDGRANVTGTANTVGGGATVGVRSILAIDSAFGSNDANAPASAQAIRGRVTGSNLTKTRNYVAGVTGQYLVTGTNASEFINTGLLGVVGDQTTTANAAVVAYLDGDGGLTTAGSAYGVSMKNSTPGSGFDYGLDLQFIDLNVAGTTAPFKQADIRFNNGVELVANVANTISLDADLTVTGITLLAGGDIVDSNGDSVLGGGSGVDNNIWVQTFVSEDGSPTDIVSIANSVEYDSSGNVIALFSHFRDNDSSRYYSVGKYTTTGTKIWTARFEDGFNTDGWGLAVAGNYIYVAGKTLTSDESGYDVSTLTKLDSSDGSIEWSKVYDFGYTSTSNVVDVASDGNPVMVGWADNNIDNYVTTTKVDAADGDIIWSRSLNGQNDEEAYGMAVGPDGEVVAIGYMGQLGEAGDTDNHMLVVKYNSSGAIQWQKAILFDAGFDCHGADADIDSDGNIYVTGSYQYNSVGFGITSALSILKLDDSGIKQWSRRIQGTCETFGISVVVGADDKLYLSAVTGFAGGNTDANNGFTWVAAKYGFDGTVEWQRLIERTDAWTFTGGLFFNGSGGSNLAVKDGYVVLGGGFGSPGDPKATVIQVAATGDVFTTGAWEFTAASFSGVLNSSASDITVSNALKTDTDNASNIIVATVTLGVESSAFLIGTLRTTGDSSDRLINGAYDVVLGSTGTVTLPAGGVISEGIVTSNPTIQLTPATPDVASQRLVIKGGGTLDYHLHLTTGDLTETSIFLGTDNHNVRTTVNGGIEITTPNTPNNVWRFDANGILTFSGTGGEDVRLGGTSTWFGFNSDASGGGIALPAGSSIDDRLTGVLISGAGLLEVNRFYLKVSNTLYEAVDEGVTYKLINQAGTWSLDVIGESNPKYTSDDLVTWTNAGGGLPAPTGELTTRETTLTVGTSTWVFGNGGKLTAPGNLQVNGGKIILNTAGNAYLESVDYGVNSVNSAVNIFGGPYQKIKIRAGFGTEATWTFGTDGKLVKLDGLTLTAGGQFNICTIVTGGSGYNTGSALKATTGGSGTGMTVAIGYGLSNQLANVTVVNPGTGYVNGDVITVSEGTGGTFTITRYNILGNQGNNNFVQSDWAFDPDGSLTLPSAGKIINNNNEWTFGTDGRLYLPNVSGGGAILRGPLNESIGISAYNDTGAGTTYTLDVAVTGQVNIPTGSTGLGRIQNPDGIEILTNIGETQKLWTFGANGNLTVPANSSILTNETALKIATHSTTTYTFNQAYWEALNGNATRMLTITGNAQYFSCTVTANQDGTYTVADLTGNSFEPGDWFKVPGNELGGVTPANDIQINIATVDGEGVILTTTITGTAVGKQWQFGTDGVLTFPDASVQTKAWAGIPGPYADDAAAATAGVAVNYPYHKTGTGGQVFVRLT